MKFAATLIFLLQANAIVLPQQHNTEYALTAGGTTALTTAQSAVTALSDQATAATTALTGVLDNQNAALAGKTLANIATAITTATNALKTASDKAVIVATNVATVLAEESNNAAAGTANTDSNTHLTTTLTKNANLIVGYIGKLKADVDTANGAAFTLTATSTILKTVQDALTLIRGYVDTFAAQAAQNADSDKNAAFQTAYGTLYTAVNTGNLQTAISTLSTIAQKSLASSAAADYQTLYGYLLAADKAEADRVALAKYVNNQKVYSKQAWLLKDAAAQQALATAKATSVNTDITASATNVAKYADILTGLTAIKSSTTGFTFKSYDAANNLVTSLADIQAGADVTGKDQYQNVIDSALSAAKAQVDYVTVLATFTAAAKTLFTSKADADTATVGTDTITYAIGPLTGGNKDDNTNFEIKVGATSKLQLTNAILTGYVTEAKSAAAKSLIAAFDILKFSNVASKAVVDTAMTYATTAATKADQVSSDAKFFYTSVTDGTDVTNTAKIKVLYDQYADSVIVKTNKATASAAATTLANVKTAADLVVTKAATVNTASGTYNGARPTFPANTRTNTQLDTYGASTAVSTQVLGAQTIVAANTAYQKDAAKTKANALVDGQTAIAYTTNALTMYDNVVTIQTTNTNTDSSVQSAGDQVGQAIAQAASTITLAADSTDKTSALATLATNAASLITKATARIPTQVSNTAATALADSNTATFWAGIIKSARDSVGLVGVAVDIDDAKTKLKTAANLVLGHSASAATAYKTIVTTQKATATTLSGNVANKLTQLEASVAALETIATAATAVAKVCGNVVKFNIDETKTDAKDTCSNAQLAMADAVTYAASVKTMHETVSTAILVNPFLSNDYKTYKLKADRAIAAIATITAQQLVLSTNANALATANFGQVDANRLLVIAQKAIAVSTATTTTLADRNSAASSANSLAVLAYTFAAKTKEASDIVSAIIPTSADATAALATSVNADSSAVDALNEAITTYSNAASKYAADVTTKKAAALLASNSDGDKTTASDAATSSAGTAIGYVATACTLINNGKAAVNPAKTTVVGTIFDTLLTTAGSGATASADAILAAANQADDKKTAAAATKDNAAAAYNSVAELAKNLALNSDTRIKAVRDAIVDALATTKVASTAATCIKEVNFAVTLIAKATTASTKATATSKASSGDTNAATNLDATIAAVVSAAGASATANQKVTDRTVADVTTAQTAALADNASAATTVTSGKTANDNFARALVAQADARASALAAETNAKLHSTKADVTATVRAGATAARVAANTATKNTANTALMRAAIHNASAVANNALTKSGSTDDAVKAGTDAANSATSAADSVAQITTLLAQATADQTATSASVNTWTTTAATALAAYNTATDAVTKNTDDTKTATLTATQTAKKTTSDQAAAELAAAKTALTGITDVVDTLTLYLKKATILSNSASAEAQAAVSGANSAQATANSATSSGDGATVAGAATAATSAKAAFAKAVKACTDVQAIRKTNIAAAVAARADVDDTRKALATAKAAVVSATTAKTAADKVVTDAADKVTAAQTKAATDAATALTTANDNVTKLTASLASKKTLAEDSEKIAFKSALAAKNACADSVTTSAKAASAFKDVATLNAKAAQAAAAKKVLMKRAAVDVAVFSNAADAAATDALAAYDQTVASLVSIKQQLSQATADQTTLLATYTSTQAALKTATTAKTAADKVVTDAADKVTAAQTQAATDAATALTDATDANTLAKSNYDNAVTTTAQYTESVYNGEVNVVNSLSAAVSAVYNSLLAQQAAASVAGPESSSLTESVAVGAFNVAVAAQTSSIKSSADLTKLGGLLNTAYNNAVSASKQATADATAAADRLTKAQTAKDAADKAVTDAGDQATDAQKTAQTAAATEFTSATTDKDLKDLAKTRASALSDSYTTQFDSFPNTVMLGGYISKEVDANTAIAQANSNSAQAFAARNAATTAKTNDADSDASVAGAKAMTNAKASDNAVTIIAKLVTDSIADSKTQYTGAGTAKTALDAATKADTDAAAALVTAGSVVDDPSTANVDENAVAVKKATDAKAATALALQKATTAKTNVDNYVLKSNALTSLVSLGAASIMGDNGRAYGEAFYSSAIAGATIAKVQFGVAKAATSSDVAQAAITSASNAGTAAMQSVQSLNTLVDLITKQSAGYASDLAKAQASAADAAASLKLKTEINTNATIAADKLATASKADLDAQTAAQAGLVAATEVDRQAKLQVDISTKMVSEATALLSAITTFPEPANQNAILAWSYGESAKASGAVVITANSKNIAGNATDYVKAMAASDLAVKAATSAKDGAKNAQSAYNIAAATLQSAANAATTAQAVLAASNSTTQAAAQAAFDAASAKNTTWTTIAATTLANAKQAQIDATTASGSADLAVVLALALRSQQVTTTTTTTGGAGVATTTTSKAAAGSTTTTTTTTTGAAAGGSTTPAATTTGTPAGSLDSKALSWTMLVPLVLSALFL